MTQPLNDPAHRPDILVCDVGDTLIRWTHYDREAGLTALRQLCDRPERFDLSALCAEGESLDSFIEPRAADALVEYRQADFLRLLFAQHALQLQCDDDNLEWHYWSNALRFEPEAGVVAALETIAAAGIGLAIVSNTAFGPACIERELARHGIARFFDPPVITSARFAVRKPRPEILRAAVGVCASEGDSVWYTGNSVYHDVGASNAAGIPVIWYNEDGEELATVAKDGERPDHTVSSWAETAELLTRLPRRPQGR